MSDAHSDDAEENSQQPTYKIYMNEPNFSETDSLASKEISKIAAALSKAQGAIKPAVADATNPHFKSKYADLAAVWDSIRKPLTDNELSIVQQVVPFGENWVVVSVLLHSSGQWMKSIFPIMAVQQTSQAMGAAVSYARRFSLNALVGVAQQEDDDGNADSFRPNQRPQNAQPRQSSPPRATTQPRPPNAQPVGSKSPPLQPGKAASSVTPAAPQFDANDPWPDESEMGPPTDFDVPTWPDEKPAPAKEMTIKQAVDKAGPAAQRALAKDKEKSTPPAPAPTRVLIPLGDLAKKRGLTEPQLSAVIRKFTSKTQVKDLTDAERKFVYDYVDKIDLSTLKKDIE